MMLKKIWIFININIYYRNCYSLMWLAHWIVLTESKILYRIWIVTNKESAVVTVLGYDYITHSVRIQVYYVHLTFRF